MKPKRSEEAGETAGRARRSACPVACLLDVVGDRWTLLVVRDLMLGRSRFREFLESPEGIPTNILSDRLGRLLGNGIVLQVPAAEGAKRLAYRLTAKGEALRPVLRAMRDWGLRWEKGTEAALGSAGKPLIRRARQPLDPCVTETPRRRITTK